MGCLFKDLADKVLEKLSTKDPEKVAKGQTVQDGWYMMGKEAKMPAGQEVGQKPGEKKE